MMADNDAKWDFFLAHATVDKRTAESFYDLLSGKCRVFLDSRSLKLGDDWDTAIPAAQRQSAITIVLVSANTERAYYQREEVAVAIDLARDDPDTHRVVPIYTDISREDKVIPYGLRLKVGIELGPDCSLAAAAKRLLDLLSSLSVEDPGKRGGANDQPDAVESLTPRPTRLALAQYGLDNGAAPMIASVCLVTDDAPGLIGELGDWKPRIQRDPLVPDTVKAVARKAKLPDLFLIDAVRARLLDSLSVTSFSAYLYFGRRDALKDVADLELRRRFFIEPLAQRLRKKSEVVEKILSNEAAAAVCVDAATKLVQAETGRPLPPIELVDSADRGSALIIELAQLVAKASADHLASPDNDEAATLFAGIRTRVRYAYDVVSRERHTRDRNPLP